MPASSDIRAGAAFLEIYLRDEKLHKGLMKVQRRLTATGAAMQQAGRRMLAAAATMAVPLGFATKSAVDFETQMAKVSTMVDDTDAHMAKLSTGVEALSKELGESTDTLAGGLYDILSATVAPEKALDVLATAGKAAKAGASDTATAADAITTILNAYKLEAEQAGEVSDWLFSIVKRGKTDFATLAPSIGMIAGTAASAGLSLDELGATIAQLTRNGVQTENAITAVQAVVASFMKPAAAAIPIARDLGFELSTKTLQEEGLLGVLKKLEGVDPETIAKIFPNLRAIRGVMPALADLQGLTDDVEAMAQKAGATDEAFSKMTRTSGHQLAQMREEISGMARDIGQALLPILRDALGTLKPMVQAVSDWARENKTAVQWIAKLAVGLAATGAVLITVGGALKGMATAVLAVKVAMLGLSKAAGLVAAHPVAAVFVGLAAAAYAIDRATKHVADLSHELKDAARANEEKRASDRAAMERLAELQKKQRLTNEEMGEARRIIADLTESYGDLGISLDAQKRKLEGVTEAQKGLNEAQKRDREKDLRAAMKESQQNQQELAKEMANPGLFHKMGHLLGMTDGDRRIRDISKEIAEERKAYEALAAELEDLVDARKTAADNLAETPERTEPKTLEEMQGKKRHLENQKEMLEEQRRKLHEQDEAAPARRRRDRLQEELSKLDQHEQETGGPTPETQRLRQRTQGSIDRINRGLEKAPDIDAQVDQRQAALDQAIAELDQAIAVAQAAKERPELAARRDTLRRQETEATRDYDLARLAAIEDKTPANEARREEARQRVERITEERTTVEKRIADIDEKAPRPDLATGEAADPRAEAERVAEEAARLHRLRLEAMEDSLEKELALIEHRYRQEMEMAGVTEERKALLRQQKEAEQAAARKEHARQEASEEAERLRETQGREQAMRDEIERLDIQLNKKGLEREKALLELRRKQALRDISGPDSALQYHLTEQKFDLEEQLLQRRQGTEEASKTVGTFSAAETLRLAIGGGATTAADRTAKATEDTAKNTVDANAKLDELKNALGEALQVA